MSCWRRPPGQFTQDGMLPLLWRSRAHLFLHPFLLPPIPSCTSHRLTTTNRHDHRGYSPTPYYRTPKPRTSTTTEPSYTLIPGARHQRYVLTWLPRRHIQTEDFNPARDEDSSHHVTFLCTKKLFVSLALKDEPQVQLHQKVPPPEDPERHTHTLQEDHRYHPK